ncbi:hypothetical protein HCN44_000309 [Aphidius gifuensis]|uniref:Uncharacterized protein n=1 Tax=Aphidius gifuensis TaxID=684658 RepID=A0A834XSJ1_APHGI|nr:hypothetical protein HCN44_000309 [Aphidius gifuensis]
MIDLTDEEDRESTEEGHIDYPPYSPCWTPSPTLYYGPDDESNISETASFRGDRETYEQLEKDREEKIREYIQETSKNPISALQEQLTKHEAHPVTWCFISNKSLDAYMSVAAKVEDLFEQAIVVNTTWNTEMQEAFRRNFAEVRGTFYSYTKTICDKFIEAKIDEDDENIIIISKLVSLAFLPPVEMNRHFYEIVERMAYDDRVIFWPLLIFVHSVWIQSVGAGLSVDVNGVGNNFIGVQRNLSRLYYNSFQRIENITLMDHLKIIIKATDCVLGYIDVDRFRPPSEWSLLMASNMHLPTIHRIYESVQRHDIS